MAAVHVSEYAAECPYGAASSRPAPLDAASMAFVRKQRALRMRWDQIAAQLGVSTHRVRTDCDPDYDPQLLVPKPQKAEGPDLEERLSRALARRAVLSRRAAMLAVLQVMRPGEEDRASDLFKRGTLEKDQVVREVLKDLERLGLVASRPGGPDGAIMWRLKGGAA